MRMDKLRHCLIEVNRVLTDLDAMDRSNTGSERALALTEGHRLYLEMREFQRDRLDPEDAASILGVTDRLRARLRFFGVRV